MSKNRKLQASLLEKDDRCYMTRGSCGGTNENGKDLMEGGCGGGEVEQSGFVLPKFFISLSSKEKEEDFMAMKGCKLPQRPKKRAKFIQKCLLLVTPGAWLCDLSHERYEVRERNCSREEERIEGHEHGK